MVLMVTAQVNIPDNEEGFFLHIFDTCFVICFREHRHFDWNDLKFQDSYNSHFPYC